MHLDSFSVDEGRSTNNVHFECALEALSIPDFQLIQLEQISYFYGVLGAICELELIF